MNARAAASGFLAILLLAGCGSTPGQTAVDGASATPLTATPRASTCATPAPDAASPDANACPGGAGAGGAGGAGGGAGGPGGGGGNTVTRTWSERVVQTGGDSSSVVMETYTATAHFTLTKVDIGAWTLSGTAEITGTFTSDFQSHTTTPLGPCNTHYTDNASATGTVAVEGGLEARDGFYQFHVDIPGVDGSNDAVRDDSGCNGPNNRETTPWSASSTTNGGNGDFADGATHISGSTTEPRTGGDDTTTWDITLTP